MQVKAWEARAYKLEQTEAKVRADLANSASQQKIDQDRMAELCANLAKAEREAQEAMREKASLQVVI